MTVQFRRRRTALSSTNTAAALPRSALFWKTTTVSCPKMSFLKLGSVQQFTTGQQTRSSRGSADRISASEATLPTRFPPFFGCSASLEDVFRFWRSWNKLFSKKSASGSICWGEKSRCARWTRFFSARRWTTRSSKIWFSAFSPFLWSFQSLL